MAHGPVKHPLEVTDREPIDRTVELGNSSLHTIDNRAIELLEQILEENKKIREALEILIEVRF